MIELHERIYETDDKYEDTMREFSSKQSVIKLLKKSPVPTGVIYDLKKQSEVTFIFQGRKRRLQIVEKID